MSVIKVSPGVWLIKVSVRVPGADNPVKKRERFRGTKVEAECREAEIITQLKAGGSLAYSKIIRTFGEAVELYKTKLRSQGRLSDRYCKAIDSIGREFGGVPLEAMPERVEAWRRHLANTPAATGKMRAAATLNRPVEIVRAVFGHLVALEMIHRNPITIIRFPKYKEKARNRYLRQEERIALINAIALHRPHILPIIKYMLMVPCRVSELTSARREQYNPFSRTIYIPDSKAGIPIHKPIPPEMYDYFDNLPVGCEWLFYREGAPGVYHPVALRRAWAECLRVAGITDLRIHDLRHVAATDLIDFGNPDEAVSLVAGWTSTVMLKRYYNHDSLRVAPHIKFSGAATGAGLTTACRQVAGK